MQLKNPNPFLIVVFLGMVAGPGLVQLGYEAAHREWPRVLQIFKQQPTVQLIRAYESEIEDSSVVVRALRPWVQAFQLVVLGQAGEQALVGRDGWFFYQPGVAYLTQRPGPGDSSVRQAIAAVSNFRDALAARGIRLILMPVPNKESVYPDKLSVLAQPPRAIQSPETRDFFKQCEEAAIEVVDLFSVYRRARKSTTESLYLAQDSHWSPVGVALAAAAAAEQICLKSEIFFRRKALKIDLHGDLVRMFQSAPIEEAIGRESVVCNQVFSQSTGAPYADDPGAEVLVLGDSFLRIYQQDLPGHAGFVAHLATELGRPLASIVNDGGASTLVRQELFRRPQLLANAKIVIWEFVERDLRLGTEGWQIVPLPSRDSETTGNRKVQ